MLNNSLRICKSFLKLSNDYIYNTLAINFEIYIFYRNSIPQSPNFPLDNQTARDHILEKVTDMFRHTFPYTTIYPSLGNLDITSSSMLNTRFPKTGSPYHRSRRPQRKGSSRNGHRRRENKGKTKRLYNITKLSSVFRTNICRINCKNHFVKI